MYARHGKELTDDGAEAEVVAAYVEKQLLTDEKAITQAVNENPALGQRIMSRLDGILARLGSGTARERLYLQWARDAYARALRASAGEVLPGGANVLPRYGEAEVLPRFGEAAAVGGAKYGIVELSDGRKYVKADRQVIFGSDPEAWGEQIERYINKKIRRGEDVILTTDDGDLLMLTRDTEGKAGFRNYTRDPATGRMRPMTDAEYEVKLNAEAHIDELAQISQRGSSVTADEGGIHGAMAEKGWNYRTAFFRDFDGKHYRVTISVAMGADGNTVYNVAQIRERNPLADSGPSAADSGAHGEKASFTDRISEKELPVNKKLSITERQEAEYMAAAEAKDVETAGRMVAQAAKAAGMTLKNGFYVNKGFKNIKPTEEDIKYFNIGKEWRERYGLTDKDSVDGLLSERIEDGRSKSWEEELSFYPARMTFFYAGAMGLPMPEAVFAKRIGKAPVGGASYNFREDSYEYGTSVLGIYKGGKYHSRNDGTYELFNDGKKYTVVGFLNPAEFGGDGEYLLASPKTLGKKTENIKSADPITYDDEGNVIPLSERFNAEKEDIRYSITNTRDMSWQEQVEGYFRRDGTIKSSDSLYLGESEPYIKGVKSSPLYFPTSVVTKATRETKGSKSAHGLKDTDILRLYEDIKNAPAVIHNPARNALVYLTENRDRDRNYIITTFDLNNDLHGENAHKATSVHGHENLAILLEKLGRDATVFVKNENKLNQMLPGNQILKSLALLAKVEPVARSVSENGPIVNGKYSMTEKGEGPEVLPRAVEAEDWGYRGEVLPRPGKEEVLPRYGEAEVLPRASAVNDAALRAENERLRKKAEYWQRQTQRTQRQTIRQDDIDKLARQLIKGFGSKLRHTDITAS